MNLLVCDDIAERGQEVLTGIVAAGQPTPTSLFGKDLLTQLQSLFRRVKTCREDPTRYEHEESPFDNFDLVIIDNNLTHLPNDDGPPLTAESIAGYLRAFTHARYLVSLNMNPDVDFDLRYLVGDFSSRADLAINTAHLKNRSLWTGKPHDSLAGFCPWYWPRLCSVADRRSRQIDFISDRLGDSVCDAFGFDDADVDSMSFHARGALSPDAATTASGESGGKPFREVTFRDVFLAKDRSLPFKDQREKLNEAEMAGNKLVRAMISRIVAADLDLWFRRDVVGPQEPLVDIPHLMLRFPFLLGEGANRTESWNEAVETTAPPFGFQPELYAKHLKPVTFEHTEFVHAVCFRWPKLQADEELNDQFFRSRDQEWADVVYCEDESLFRERSPEGEESAPVEFAAEFEGAWNRRYVSGLKGIRYAPRTRLAL